MKPIKTLILAATLCGLTTTAQAQFDEIVVTATRENQTVPSVSYTRKGDFLLLQVQIESDARETGERLAELEKTIEAFVKAASKDAAISLSFIDDGEFVRPLTPALYQDAIGRGSRPDTSVARVQVKTPIPENVPNAFALARKLSDFVLAREETGRVTISTFDEVTVSVVNPNQYRSNVVKAIADDINDVTTALGPNYRVILEGLDKPMNSFRSGDLSLSFFLPYKYVVIPDTLQSYRVDMPEDY